MRASILVGTLSTFLTLAFLQSGHRQDSTWMLMHGVSIADEPESTTRAARQLFQEAVGDSSCREVVRGSEAMSFASFAMVLFAIALAMTLAPMVACVVVWNKDPLSRSACWAALAFALLSPCHSCATVVCSQTLVRLGKV